MIPLDAEVFVALEPIDLRMSFDLLAGLVRERFGADPKGGALYIFFGKRREKLKALFYDKTGYCILYKRLCRGTFAIPTPERPGETTLHMAEELFAALLDGLGREEVTNKRKKKTELVH